MSPSEDDLSERSAAFSARLFDQNAFAIKLGLDNMRRALSLEGHPERCAPAIVVGGTNGKGSVASATAAILSAHGLRVGLYTSPHLVELRERFRIDGVPVSVETVLRAGEPLLRRYGADAADPRLSFFELTTLMAAQIFAEAAVDVVVWEVGLGGRLDAVNAIEPALTVITNIDFDHQQYLGSTIAAIAKEKAALHRAGVSLVLGPQTHEEAARTCTFAETIFVAPPGGPPESRAENLATARRAAREFLQARWDSQRAQLGEQRWRWPGRMDERQARGRRFLLDAAHNPAGTARLLASLRDSPPAAFVIGAMADKDLRGMFGGLARLNRPVYLVEVASKRAAGAQALAEAVEGATVIGSGDASAMFDRASIEQQGTIAVFGSVYLLGEWFAWARIGASELVTLSPDWT